MWKLRSVLLLIVLFALSNCGVAFAEDDYILGGGDVVRISVYGHQDLSTVARVNETGNITFPLIGEVKVGGLTLSRTESKIAKALEAGGYVRGPQVNAIVDQFRSRQVSVLGQVNKPGKYSIDSEAAIVDLIAMAGGLTNQAADVIRLIRNQGHKLTFQKIDLYAMLQGGDMNNNINVINGDVIYVPLMDRFYIYGEVQRAGVFRLDRDMTVMQAIAVGGGLTPRGTERDISIRRKSANGKTVDLSAKITDVLRPDDVVYIKEGLL